MPAEEEFTDALDTMDETQKGIDKVSDSDDLSREEKSEIEKISKQIKSMKDIASSFKSVMDTEDGEQKSIMTFVAQTVATGVIFYGVNVVLQKFMNDKKTSPADKEKYKKIQQLIQAINGLITSETTISQELLKWMKDHKGSMIKLDDFEVPLESIFVKYINPISKAVQKAYKVAKPLQQKIAGDTTWKIPSDSDISQIIDVTSDYIKAFSSLQQFIAKNMKQLPELITVPISEDTIDELKGKFTELKGFI